MSDARNSSNSLRGAKSSGRSNKLKNNMATGSLKSTGLKLNGVGGNNERMDAKKKLQLQLASKQFSKSINDALSLSDSHYTKNQQAYKEYSIPLPSTEDAKKKLQAMKDFTEKWYDKDFREEWLQTLTQLWLDELKEQYEAAVKAAKEKAGAK
ncbi:hypothetical protein FRACYDRAFT_234897 [Fragilariopsis cylindrus CCMP1102]|uniref:Uncharacterized protein n=1 Tax=Fragilariopsis cylindrus CCMP1102 TaxID=635003 RepID=A0A1E7FSW8_9STRA|nr:hypothetical protein FRACYDRAFT_234897 [Fragilariopsis cylindrus CCMP1102]|eukprot:OEU21270.1 hypothetical protein FRACYDRAFT_234897 [Fragilariopsis cylindrus CCMP1102]